MKNKVKLKRILKKISIVFIIFISVISLLNIYFYHVYRHNFNSKINNILNKVMVEYPGIDKNTIIEIINNKDSNNILDVYGINLLEDEVIKENGDYFKICFSLNIIVVITFTSLIIYLFLKYNKEKDSELLEITNYIEEINNKNYKLYIDSISEDELSILKNEIYKVTINLKSMAEANLKDKINIKQSLEDISHQLKTPLTSILIILDNLLDDNNMERWQQEEFYHTLKREVTNIKFLITNILKLSEFDTNTIKFLRSEVLVKDLIEEVVKNVSTLSDLKNIKINVKGGELVKIYGDKKWQIEALTNIVKNALEYSNYDSEINIKYSQNKVYTTIVIEDFGSGISKKDMPHIFERFYKGENASSDSFGIGMSLAKEIINKDNGTVSITSSKRGTTFTIKYFSGIM